MSDLKEIKELLRAMMPGEPVPEDVWETKDSRRVFIVDMTDKHLVNTLLYLKRKAKNMVISNFTQFDTNKEFWRMVIPLELKAKFNLMEAEAIKRGLTNWESRQPIKE